MLNLLTSSRRSMILHYRPDLPLLLVSYHGISVQRPPKLRAHFNTTSPVFIATGPLQCPQLPAGWKETHRASRRVSNIRHPTAVSSKCGSCGKPSNLAGRIPVWSHGYIYVTVPCVLSLFSHHGMVCPQDAYGGNGLQIWTIAVNILNKLGGWM
jgi:hypothetical protein